MPSNKGKGKRCSHRVEEWERSAYEQSDASSLRTSPGLQKTPFIYWSHLLWVFIFSVMRKYTNSLCLIALMSVILVCFHVGWDVKYWHPKISLALAFLHLNTVPNSRHRSVRQIRHALACPCAPSCVCVWPRLEAGTNSCKFAPRAWGPGSPITGRHVHLQAQALAPIYFIQTKLRGRETVNVILLDVWRANGVGRYSCDTGSDRCTHPPTGGLIHLVEVRVIVSDRQKKTVSRFCNTEMWIRPVSII